MNKPNFNIKNLNIIMTNKLSCISKIEQSTTILLHPMFSGKMEEGIKVELDSLTNKYSNEFSGILLGYEAVKVISNLGMVFDTFPYIHVDIIAKLFIFRPTIEAIVEGIVVKKSPHHIGCLVHDLFNVSCVIPSNINKEKWLGSSVQEGDHLHIQIIEIDMKSVVPYFKGKIESVSLVNTKKIFIDEDDSEINTSSELSLAKQPKKIKSTKKVKEFEPEESLSKYQVNSSPEKDEHSIKTKKSKKEKEVNCAKIKFEGNIKDHISSNDEEGMCEEKSIGSYKYTNWLISPKKVKKSKKMKEDQTIKDIKVKSEYLKETCMCESENESEINISHSKQKKKKKISNEYLNYSADSNDPNFSGEINDTTNKSVSKYYSNDEYNLLKKKVKLQSNVLDTKDVFIKVEPISVSDEESCTERKSHKKKKIKVNY